jgi:DNA-binding XRE family transcriptional regulator
MRAGPVTSVIYMTFLDRFWAKVVDGGGCWEWAGCRVPDGYGHIKSGKTALKAHRLSWELANKKEVPEGLYVCHSCDNPSCVNPAHLWLGSAKDNSRDAMAKGRSVVFQSGTRNPAAKLTKAAVSEIRALRAQGRTGRELAARYGVSKQAIYAVERGENWASE